MNIIQHMNLNNFTIHYDSKIIVNELNSDDMELNNNSNFFFKIFESNKIHIKYTDTYYVGEFNILTYKKQGKGTLIYNNNDANKLQYQGNFVNDIIHGIGLMFYDNNYIYYGSWKNNKRHGFGILSCNGKIIYYGFWKNEMKNGFGKYFYINNSTYEGY